MTFNDPVHVGSVETDDDIVCVDCREGEVFIHAAHVGDPESETTYTLPPELARQLGNLLTQAANHAGCNSN